MMDEALRVLLVEDSPDDARLVERALGTGGLDVELRRVETAPDLCRALERPWDVVLADYRLPDFSAPEALRIVRERHEHLPVVVVTGSIGEERAAELLRAGANDFLLKENLGRLSTVVERVLGEASVRRERRRAQRVLERERERYAALIERASDVVFILGADGRVRFASPSVVELLGLEPRAVVGTDALELVHPDDRARVRAALVELLESGGTGRVEYRFVHPDGSVRHVESVGTNLLDADAVQGVVVNTRDVSERKALEKQLLQAQKMEAIGRLTGGIAHDFNNLLTVITGNSEIVLQRLAEDQPEHDDVAQVLDAARRAAALTRQLLAFSRQQVLQPRVVDVRKVVGDMMTMLRRLVGEDVAVSLDITEEPCHARVDPVQLEQVLMNLAVNAREVMPTGGRVSARVERVEGADVRQADRIRILFSDTGPGIPEELRPKVFEPFFSTKAHGTGLGLATVYGIVKQSDGDIEVRSEPGRGATFVIHLPAAEPVVGEESDDDEVEEAPTDAPGDARILLVEDNDDVRDVAVRILRREGFDVVEVPSGAAALERLGRDGVPDLLVTDLVMPGMGGPELARRVRSELPGLPVLFMSGYSGDELLEPHEISEHGTFLEKPFTPGELVGRVRMLLGGAAA